MAKQKYKFNPDSLSYTRVTKTPKQKFLRFLTYFAGSIVLALFYVLIFTSFFESPIEKNLNRQISELETNYDLINKQLTDVEALLVDLQKRDDNIYRTIFETEPIPSTYREAGFGGTNRYRELEKLDNSEVVIDVKTKLDKIMKKIYIQSVSYDKIITLAKSKEKMLSSIPAIMPISNKDLTRTASGWGYRIHPIYKIRKFHAGMDFTAPNGTEIYATGDGTIEVLESSKRGYGNMIRINHGFGYKTVYAHLSRFKVKEGQTVRRGDVIGYVGNTGLSTAPHLHYEVILNNNKVNPVNYYFNDLSPAEFDRMIEISMNSGQTFD